MVFSGFFIAKIIAYARQHDAAVQRLAQHLVDESPIGWREPSQRLRQVVGDRQLGGNDAGEMVFVRFRIEWLYGKLTGQIQRRQPKILSGQRRNRRLVHVQSNKFAKLFRDLSSQLWLWAFGS
jgi:hypothetical protein